MSLAYKSVMLEIFQNFEQMTGRFAPLVMIVSGVVFLLLGLCIWLSGLALRKILISIAGLAAGIVVGLFIVGRNIFSASLSGALAALIALIFEKVLAVLLAAALASAIAFAVLSEPYFEKAEITEVQSEISEQTTTAGLDETLKELKKFGLDAGEKIKRAGTKIPIHIWTIIAAPGVIFLICGALLWRWNTALFFSVTGTAVICLGIILLLSYKGAEPVSHIRSMPFISVAVFLAVAGFGTIVQLLLCKGLKKEKITKIKPDKGNKKDKKEPKEIVEHDWRSA